MINPNWFAYHKPTDVTAPKHHIIDTAFKQAMIGLTVGGLSYSSINSEIHGLATTIDDVCPESDDKKRSIAALRLARNAFNESISQNMFVPAGTLMDYGIKYMHEARWLANSAIALEGK